ncbi:hypothetical protein YC2023_010375 [Brassica napus]
MVGPIEEISFYGHPVTYMAPSVYGHPHALTMHFQSYMNKMKPGHLILVVKDSVIHVFIPARRANHYRPSLKAGSIVKVVRFEVARCSSMYKITDHLFLIRFIPPTIIDKASQGSDLTKEKTRVVIRLLIGL